MVFYFLSENVMCFRGKNLAVIFHMNLLKKRLSSWKCDCIYLVYVAHTSLGTCPYCSLHTLKDFPFAVPSTLKTMEDVRVLFESEWLSEQNELGLSFFFFPSELTSCWNILGFQVTLKCDPNPSTLNHYFLAQNNDVTKIIMA